MSRIVAGGCACGALRYEARAEPIVELHCQCRDCQRRSGTGHSSYLTFAGRAAVSITGKAGEWRVAGDSGTEKVHAFCPACGAPVWLTFPTMPDVIAIHAGSLDEPGRFRPRMVTYARRGHAWDRMDASLKMFDAMPPG